VLGQTAHYKLKLITSRSFGGHADGRACRFIGSLI